MNTFLSRATCVVLVVGGIFAIPSFVAAQVPCGDIVGPAGFSGPIVTTPIIDCADPFLRTTRVESPYTFSIDGAVVADGGVVEIAPEGTNTYTIEGTPLQSTYVSHLYTHDGSDYRYIDTTGEAVSEAELRTSVRFEYQIS